MAGKFWVTHDRAMTPPYSWAFISPNGRTIADSATRTCTEREAVASLSLFRARTPRALVVGPDGARVPFAFMLHESRRGYCWEFTGREAEPLAWCYLPYDTLRAAFKGISSVRRLAEASYLVRPGDARQPTTHPRAVRARPYAPAALTDRGRVREFVERANAEVLAAREA